VPDSKELYSAVVHETNPIEVDRLIKEATSAIERRSEELKQSPDGHIERQEIEDALVALLILKSGRRGVGLCRSNQNGRGERERTGSPPPDSCMPAPFGNRNFDVRPVRMVRRQLTETRAVRPTHEFARNAPLIVCGKL
jgi:hypothetical protein